MKVLLRNSPVGHWNSSFPYFSKKKSKTELKTSKEFSEQELWCYFIIDLFCFLHTYHTYYLYCSKIKFTFSLHLRAKHTTTASIVYAIKTSIYSTDTSSYELLHKTSYKNNSLFNEQHQNVKQITEDTNIYSITILTLSSTETSTVWFGLFHSI